MQQLVTLFSSHVCNFFPHYHNFRRKMHQNLDFWYIYFKIFFLQIDNHVEKMRGLTCIVNTNTIREKKIKFTKSEILFYFKRSNNSFFKYMFMAFSLWIIFINLFQIHIKAENLWKLNLREKKYLRTITDYFVHQFLRLFVPLWGRFFKSSKVRIF